MTTPSQLGMLRTEIDDLKAEIVSAKEALAATQSATETDFQHKQLEQLNRQLSSLREQETILLQGQVSGEHCLRRYLLPLSCLSFKHTCDKCACELSCR